MREEDERGVSKYVSKQVGVLRPVNQCKKEEKKEERKEVWKGGR